MKAGQLRKYALSLPGTTEEPHFDFSSFRVKGKIFATLPPDEQHVHIFVDDQALAMATDVFSDWIAPLPWGKRIVGIRVDLAKSNPDALKELLRNAWTRKAPKSLSRAAG